LLFLNCWVLLDFEDIHHSLLSFIKLLLLFPPSSTLITRLAVLSEDGSWGLRLLSFCSGHYDLLDRCLCLNKLDFFKFKSSSVNLHFVWRRVQYHQTISPVHVLPVASLAVRGGLLHLKQLFDFNTGRSSILSA